MAFAAINFEKSGLIKEAPVGFSWTTLIFGFFPALIRNDLKWAIIIFAAALVTFGLAIIVFAFIYNRLYIESLVEKGFKVKNYSGNKILIEKKVNIKLKK